MRYANVYAPARAFYRPERWHREANPEGLRELARQNGRRLRALRELREQLARAELRLEHERAALERALRELPAHLRALEGEGAVEGLQALAATLRGRAYPEPRAGLYERLRTRAGRLEEQLGELFTRRDVTLAELERRLEYQRGRLRQLAQAGDNRAALQLRELAVQRGRLQEERRAVERELRRLERQYERLQERLQVLSYGLPEERYERVRAPLRHQEVLEALNLAVKDVLVRAARGELRLPGLEAWRGSARYAAALEGLAEVVRVRRVAPERAGMAAGERVWEVSLALPAGLERYEEGYLLDLKPGLLHGPRSRVGQAGYRYTIVPFQHLVATRRGELSGRPVRQGGRWYASAVSRHLAQLAREQGAAPRLGFEELVPLPGWGQAHLLGLPRTPGGQPLALPAAAYDGGRVRAAYAALLEGLRVQWYDPRRYANAGVLLQARNREAFVAELVARVARRAAGFEWRVAAFTPVDELLRSPRRPLERVREALVAELGREAAAFGFADLQRYPGYVEFVRELWPRQEALAMAERALVLELAEARGDVAGEAGERRSVREALAYEVRHPWAPERATERLRGGYAGYQWQTSQWSGLRYYGPRRGGRGGYLTFRTVAEPRFDAHGRYVGSHPNSWLVRRAGAPVARAAWEAARPLVEALAPLL